MTWCFALVMFVDDVLRERASTYAGATIRLRGQAKERLWNTRGIRTEF